MEGTEELRRNTVFQSRLWLGCCHPEEPRRCSWAKPLRDLSTTLPIGRMNSAHSTTFLPKHEWNAVGGVPGDNLLREAFFETAAPRAADLVLVLEIAMGVGLLVGARLARNGRFRQHAWCQSAIVLLNLVVVVVMMIPSFRVHVLPRIPA